MNGIERNGLDIPVAAAVIKYGSECRIVRANENFAHLLGFADRTLEDADASSIVCRQDLCLLEETMEQAVRMRNEPTQELRVLCADGKVRWVEIRCRLLAHVNALPFLMIVLWDIHERKIAQVHSALVEQKYEMMERLSHEFPLDVDVEGWKMLRSRRLAELRGDFETEDRYYPVETELSLLHPSDRGPFLKALQDAARVEREGSIDTRFCVREKDGTPEYLWFRTFYKSASDEQGQIVRIIGRSFNIDSDKQLQEEVRRDPLTRLLNKIEVQREVAEYLKERRLGTHALLLIDVDDFKGINDTFGHTFGDMVITDVAAVIQEQFRSDDIVGRVGGDEFLVFMKDTELKAAQEKAALLCEVLSKDYGGGEVNCHISISVGIAMYQLDGSTYAALFEKADHAMYRAKQRGKNTFETANASDTGPILSGRRVIERSGKMRQEDQEFLVFAMNLLAHARNLDGSLNMLLKRIVERYQLGLAAVFEISEDGSESVMTNYYSSRFSYYDKITIPVKKGSDMDLLPPGGYAVCRSSELEDFRKNVRVFKAQNYPGVEQPFSIVYVKYEYVAERTGYMVYLSLDEERIWQQSEVEMLQELTRTVAIFVTLRYRMDESRAKIRRIQKRDQLTELYNQEAFKEKAILRLREAKKDRVYAFAYIDVDNFGYVNENYGYKAGDSILKLFAADVSAQSYFVIGSRLYSDFFLLLLETTGMEDLREHIRNCNNRFLHVIGHRYPNSGMGITAGVYMIEHAEHVDIDAAIENANLAWKYAKNHGGRNAVFFDPSFRTMRAKEQQVVGEFFESLRRGDFRLYLQPKFILGDRSVYGAEALSRWMRPDGSVKRPQDYIDSLERIGYVIELDFYIFEALLRTMEKWEEKGYRKVVVSTNFSGRHFAGDGEAFLDRIAHIMSKYRVSSGCVEIEVTEGVLIRNLETLQRCIGRLHEMGFRVAIDDFGTGYSSLSVLADVPADVVKIDRNFINKNMTDRRLTLLYEIGRMVKILGKDIIIEGVETPEQERYLKEGGFVCGQGYLCSGPVAAAEFERLYLKKYKNDAAKT